MDVNIFDCNTINEYMSRNEACKNSNENYFWTAPSGIRYVCDNRKMREPRSKELENGICVNDAEIKNGMYCSIKNGWIDNQGRVFIYYSIKNICVDLNCGTQKACKLLDELEKVGALERKRQGLGRPNKLYLKKMF